MANNIIGYVIFNTIFLTICVITIIYSVKVYIGTKNEKNPIEQYEHEHNVTNRLLLYSPEFPSLKNEPKINKYCQCGNIFLNDICTEEQINKGCYDITLNEQNNLLRNLVDASFCSEVKDEINKNKKFSEIFTLNYAIVSKDALGILFFNSCLAVVIIFIISFLFCTCYCQETAIRFVLKSKLTIFSAIITCGLIDLICFIIMLVKYYKGMTTGKFHKAHFINFIFITEFPHFKIFKKFIYSRRSNKMRFKIP